MWRKRTLVFLGIAGILAQALGYGRPGVYEGYKVLRATPNTRREVRYLNELENIEPMVDFWSRSLKVGHDWEFMVPPSALRTVRNYLRQGRIKFEIQSDDVERTLAENREEGMRRRQLTAAAFDYDEFHTYDEIMTEADELVNKCPTSHGYKCEVYSIGQSYENREQKIFRIYKDEPNRPIYWFDALNHAREWISGAVQLKIIKHLVDDVDTDEEVQRMLGSGDWHFLLILNPDGYEYTWTNARLWRNSRSNDTDIYAETGCVGVNLNRNFIHRWMNAGTSRDPCHTAYGGSGPGSEIETQNVVNEVYRIESRLRAMVTLHSYGEYILMPWGSCIDPGVEETCEFLKPDIHQKVLNVVNAMVTAIEATHNGALDWIGGTACDVLYPSSGTVDDFVAGFTGMPYAFNPELRGGFNNGTRYNFVPPASEIHPAFQEMWAGVVAMVDTIDQQEN